MSAPRSPVPPSILLATCLAWTFGFADTAEAVFLSGEALDTAAEWVSWIVIVLVPLIAITVFWIVHVLPEKIAHKRHHPQRDAIQTLCLLSLFFGGLLWPIAWLWAYTRPVAYKVAYGTDKHEDFVLEQLERVRAGTLDAAEFALLRAELDAMERRGALTPELSRARDELAAMVAAGTAPAPAPPSAAIARPAEA